MFRLTPLSLLKPIPIQKPTSRLPFILGISGTLLLLHFFSLKFPSFYLFLAMGESKIWFFNDWEQSPIDDFCFFWFCRLRKKKERKMGNASSMLTQYDIEDVQEHCNNLCMIFYLLIYFKPFETPICEWKYFIFSGCSLVSQQEIVSLYRRFCQLDRNAKGFISADEFLSVPEFAMNPLSQVGFWFCYWWTIDKQDSKVVLLLFLLWFLILGDVSYRGYLKWLMDWISRIS